MRKLQTPLVRQAAIVGGALLAMLSLVAAFTWWWGDAQSARVLSGQIRDERTRQPVAGALVRASRAGDAREIKSDEAGRYRLGVAADALTVSVSARGYQATVGVFDTAPAVREYALDVILRPHVVGGIVRDGGTQKAVEDVVISAGDAATQTDADGRYTLEHLEPGDPIRVEASGYFSQTAPWSGTLTLDFSLTARTITVVVVGAGDRKPLAAAIGVAGAKHQADAQGRVTVREPPAGARITASFEDYATGETAYAGQAVVELALKPSAFKAVVKSGRSGKPIAGADIFLDGVHVAVSNDDGKFGLAEVKPGARLKVKAAAHQILDIAVPSAQSAELTLVPFAARGVYVPFGLLGSESRIAGLMDLADRTELNALVVDIKSDRGKLAFNPTAPALKTLATPEVKMDVRTLLQRAHAKGIYVIARFVTFKDEALALKRPDLAVKTKAGGIWRDGEKLAWANPYNREVWNYNLALVKEIAELGFDEVQFDYIRFPSDGNVSAIYFPGAHTQETRIAALRGFLNEVGRVLTPYPIFVSADIFGMTAWTKDDMGIGQKIEEIAPRVDYVQPMLYPHTFSADNLGYKNPPAHPYDVIYRSVKSAQERVSTPVRPWLQAYSGRNPTYTLKDYLAQKRAANDAGSNGWTFWNAAGVYDAALFGGP